MGGAVFSDVEGTLVDGSIPGLALVTGLEIGLFSRWQKAQIGVLGQVARRGSRDLARRVQLIALIRATAGLSTEQVDRWLDALTPTLRACIKPPMLARIEAHQAEGLPLVLVSGGLHAAIALLAAELGGRGEGTKIRQRNGRYTSRLDGAVCQGPAKADRARAVLAEMGYDPAQCYGYGDTASDLPFLELFGHPHIVDPDPALAEEARRRGWPIVRC